MSISLPFELFCFTSMNLFFYFHNILNTFFRTNRDKLWKGLTASYRSHLLHDSQGHNAIYVSDDSTMTSALYMYYINSNFINTSVFKQYPITRIFIL